ncbi:uncharacterized protein Triagg1_7813 [Trichoderma aggressivum f. europaeum]|uniref:Uncharacterized protein n=1 Tax=Trichoderma aggressivum f. europaeum TaxID=173218 RepID=A0AAE1IAX2_9HYPO|nr:hypothetical protein Triagg1_7813 [Trichoderma aggressivum f. europaeum]
MTKRACSDRRPYDTRPVSLIRSGQVQSQDALDNLSRYEEVSRQFAQEFPQIARSIEQHSWIPCFLSPNTGRQESRATAPADGAMAADSIASPIGGLAYDSQFATTAGYDISMYIDDNCFDALPFATTTATTSPTEQSSDPDSFTPPGSDADFDPTCNLQTSASQPLWYDELEESRYNHPLQNWNAEQTEKQWDGPNQTISESLIAPPVEHTRSSDLDDEALAEASQVDQDRINQIMINLNQLESRLREDVRRQLDVISNDLCCEA